MTNISAVRTDLAIAKATARQHVQAAAKYTAMIEMWPMDLADAVIDGYKLDTVKRKAGEAKKLALQWQTKADDLAEAATFREPLG